MTILADVRTQGKMTTVHVTNVFEAGGRKLASVEALQGEPFTEWTHGGPSYTDTARIPADWLENVREEGEEQPERKPNLLELALEQERAAWPMSETVWLIPGKAYLHNDDCHIRLYVKGYRKGCTIFSLDLANSEWKPNPYAALDYRVWAKAARLALGA